MSTNEPSIEEDTSNEEEDSVNNFIKLKIKIYHLTCPQHPCFIRKRSFMGLHKIELSELFNNQAILYELRTSNFLGYATIIIWMNYQCLCRLHEGDSENIVESILKAFNKNIQNIRYMTKIFHFNYTIHTNVLKYQDQKRFKCYRYYFDNIQKDKTYKDIDLIQPITKELTTMATETSRVKEEDDLTKMDRDYLQMALKDYGIYANNLEVEHLIFLQYITYDSYMETHLSKTKFPSFHKLIKLFQYLKPKEYISVNEILYTEMLLIKRTQSTFNDDLVMAHCFANVDLYFHSINSAIAIIINNKFLNSTKQSTRHGSDVDVEKLCYTFKITKTLHCKLNDLNKDKLQQFMYWLRYANFKPYKNVYLFFMSHGHEKGVLYTEDGNRVYLQDILNDLKHNQTADEAKIFIYIVACRGSYDARYASGPKPDETQHKIELGDNMAIFLSTREGRVSLRHRVKGTPFVTTVTEHLMAAEHNADVVRVIGGKLKPKQTEHLVKDQSKCYNINKHTMALTPDVKDNFTNNSTKLSQILDCKLELNEDLEITALTQTKDLKTKAKNETETKPTATIRRYDSILFLHLFGPIQNLHTLEIFEFNLKFLENYKEDFKEYFIITTQYLLHNYELFIEESLSKMFSDQFLLTCQWQTAQDNTKWALKNLEIIQVFWQLAQEEFNIKDYDLYENCCKNWLAKAELRIFKDYLAHNMLNEFEEQLQKDLKGLIDLINLSPKAKNILKEEFGLAISNDRDLHYLTVGLGHIFEIKQEQDLEKELFNNNNYVYNTFVNTFCVKTYQKNILLKKETFFYDRDRVGDIEFGHIKAEIFNTSQGIFLIRHLKEMDFVENLEEYEELGSDPDQLDNNLNDNCLEFLVTYAPLETKDLLIKLEQLLKGKISQKDRQQQLELYLKLNSTTTANNDYGDNYKTFIEDSLNIIFSNSLLLDIQKINIDKLEILNILWLCIENKFKEASKITYQNICHKWWSESYNRILKSAILKKLLYLPLDNESNTKECFQVIENSHKAKELIKDYYALHIPMAYQRDYNLLIAIWYVIHYKYSTSGYMPAIVTDIIQENIINNDPFFKELPDLYKFQFYNNQQFLVFDKHIKFLDMKAIFDNYFKIGLTITKDLEFFVKKIWLKLLHKNVLHLLTWDKVKHLKITKIIEELFYSHSQISPSSEIFSTLSQEFFHNFTTKKLLFLIRELPLKTFDNLREYEEILKLSPQTQKQLEMFFYILWCDEDSMANNIFTILNHLFDLKKIKQKFPSNNNNFFLNLNNSFLIQFLKKFVKTYTPQITDIEFYNIIKICFAKNNQLKICESSINHFVQQLPFSSLETLLINDKIFSEDSNNFKQLQVYFQYFSLNHYNFENVYNITNIWCEIINDKLLLELLKFNIKTLNISKALNKAFLNKFSLHDKKFDHLFHYWFDENRINLSSLIYQMPFTSNLHLIQFDSYLKASNYAYQYFYNFFNYLPGNCKTHSLIYALIFNIPKFWSLIISPQLKASCLWQCIETDETSLHYVNDKIIINDFYLTKIFKEIYCRPHQFDNISMIWFNNLVNDIIDKFSLVYGVNYKSLRLT